MLLKRLVYGLIFALVAGILAAVASYFAISVFSSNMHDRSVEASMTSIFVFGPAAALVGLVCGIVFGGRKRERRK